jgi:hypothetical protein
VGSLTSEAAFLPEGEGGDATGLSAALPRTDADGARFLVLGHPSEDGAPQRSGAVLAAGSWLPPGPFRDSDNGRSNR